MRKILLSLLLSGLFCASIAAQKISKPTLTASEATAAQKSVIQEGIALHDSKKYGEAAKKYREVLQENPDCTFAMYELALTYYANLDYQNALEVAFKGTKYKSKELSLFYGIIANVWDDKGQSDEAIKLYQDGIKMLRDEKDSDEHLSSLYFNLGVTYTRLKKYSEAREALKKAVEYNFGYASPSYVLAEIFSGTKYKVPGLLAAARLISLETNTPRAARSVKIFLDALNSAQKDEKTGNINIFMDINAPKDEGDFAMYDLLLGTLTAVKTDEDKNKTDEEIFAGAVDTLIAMLSEDKKISKTFVGKTYIPFMAEMKKQGFSKIFAYLVLQKNGNKAAEKWLVENERKTLDFFSWAKSYKAAKRD
ncbi:MAG TPA: tetratricopeptide repeat protein [Pyrinomonadaceae bacterium]